MSIDYTQACSSRLPCGLCLITNQACPFFTQHFDVTCSQTGVTTTYTGTIGSDSASSKYTSDYNDMPD